MNIDRKDVTIEEGLALAGVEGRTGHVMVERITNKPRFYAVTYRARDKKLLYRGGDLVRAEATYFDGVFSHVVFYAW